MLTPGTARDTGSGRAAGRWQEGPIVRLLVLLLLIAVSLPVSSGADARSQGDEAGTLKGVRGPSQPPASGVPKTKPGKGQDLIEDEGVWWRKNKPAGTPKSR
jgi:hypothetical protein